MVTVKRGSHIDYFDNLRWVLIILVVLVHINVTYSGIGSWYYVEQHELSFIQTALFGLFGSFQQAYFMGLLFFVAGFFVSGSIKKKGVSGFIKGRSFRLGIPTLFFMLCLHPLTVFVLDRFNSFLDRPFAEWYIDYILHFKFIGSSGPLWFALALLIFSIIHALSLNVINVKITITDKNIKIKSRHLFTLGAIIAAGTFFVRTLQPIGTSLLNMQLCFFTQYVVLFLVGILCGKFQLLDYLSEKVVLRWFAGSIAAGIPFWGVTMIAGGASEGSLAYAGGLTWQSAAYSLWESFTAVSVSAGLIVVFRRRWNYKNRLMSFLSSNAFGVYVLHTPMLVFYSLLVKNWGADPMVKWLAAGVVVIPAAFILSSLVRKIPLVGRIFS